MIGEKIKGMGQFNVEDFRIYLTDGTVCDKLQKLMNYKDKAIFSPKQMIFKFVFDLKNVIVLKLLP